MNWFQGTINEAVSASKTKKAIFVVFVEGKDDASKRMAKEINSDEVSTRLEQEEFVAIRLESGSESFEFFQQIYQLVPIPSLFFIGQNGSPLEVVAGETNITDLSERIDAVIAKSNPKSKNSSASFIDSEQAAGGAPHSAGPEPTPVGLNINKSATNLPAMLQSSEQLQLEGVTSSTQSNVVPTPDVFQSNSSTRSEKVETPSTSSTTPDNLKNSELTPDEKVERARKLIELQKKQREDEEAKKEREREIQRRKTGQDMLKMKQKQQELEIKQAHEERMREKAAEAAAREKVRQQIAQDRLERKQREQQHQQYTQQTTPTQEVRKPRTPESSDSSHARIQFRLPSGSTHMGRFESISTLAALRTYVVDNIELPFRQFTLVTSYPRREFSSDDDSKTLLELNLVPTSVLLILPLRSSNSATTVTSATNVGFLSGFLWTIFASISSMYNYVRGYFFGTHPRPVGTPNSESSSTDGQSRASSTDRPASLLAHGSASPTGLLRRNVGGLGNTTVRTQGNVHQLHSGEERDNDENNTWNGNSTQQM